MEQVGSYVAVYQPDSYGYLIDTIKSLQAVGYTPQQISSLIQNQGAAHGGLDLQKSQQHISDLKQSLRDLLISEIALQVADVGNLIINGGLSDHITPAASTEPQLSSLLSRAVIPRTSANYYKMILNSGNFLLITLGDVQQLEQAGQLLESSNSIEVSLHIKNKI